MIANPGLKAWARQNEPTSNWDTSQGAKPLDTLRLPNYSSCRAAVSRSREKQAQGEAVVRIANSVRCSVKRGSRAPRRKSVACCVKGGLPK